MTPEQAARFVLSDCQDSQLKAIADREFRATLREALQDPVFKAEWDACMQEMVDDADRRVAAHVYDRLRHGQ